MECIVTAFQILSGQGTVPLVWSLCNIYIYIYIYICMYVCMYVCICIPYSRKLSRDKTFAVFANKSSTAKVNSAKMQFLY